MRRHLQALAGQRLRFVGIFARFGTKNGYRGPDRTLLLRDVCLYRAPDHILTDHLWFTCGKTFDQLHLHPGDQVIFDARVTEYDKGYQGRRAEESGEAWAARDYRLERPTRAEKILADASI